MPFLSSARFIRLAAFSVAVTLGAVPSAQAACSWWEVLWCNEPPPPSRPSVVIARGPDKADLIRAVQGHLGAKTYTEYVVRRVAKRRYCSQYDVDRDPYMPRNPELAKCPRIGASYTVYQDERVPEERNCPEPSGGSAAWSVTDLGNDHWRVATGGSSWVVRLISGQKSSVGSTTASDFRYQISANQGC